MTRDPLKPRKQSIQINDCKTSVSLSDSEYKRFKQIADERDMLLGELAAEIEAKNPGQKISYAIRTYIDKYKLKRKAAADTA